MQRSDPTRSCTAKVDLQEFIDAFFNSTPEQIAEARLDKLSEKAESR